MAASTSSPPFKGLSIASENKNPRHGVDFIGYVALHQVQ
jgi:hypothetical protein